MTTYIEEKLKEDLILEVTPVILKSVLTKWRKIRVSEHKPTSVFVRRWLGERLDEAEAEVPDPGVLKWKW